LISRSDRTIALAIITLASALTPFTVSAVNIALPTIGTELGFNAVTLGWIPTAYLLASAIFPANEKGRVLGINTAAVYLRPSSLPWPAACRTLSSHACWPLSVWA
jgi:MFS family permease